jgi:hypothetical protein
MIAPAAEISALQRRLTDGALRIVGSGMKEDAGASKEPEEFRFI